LYKICPNSLFVGQKIVYLPSCQSTNDEAANLLLTDDLPEGTAIVTDQQTKGRGQRGNRWEAEAGQNLTVSFVLKPTFLVAQEQFWLNIAVSLAINDLLTPLLPAGGLRIKWPNDVYVFDRKLGGVLLENTLQGYSVGHSVVGIGLNINQTAFGLPTATSLQLEAPIETGYQLPALLTALCEQLEKRYLQLRLGRSDAQRTQLRATYLNHLYRFGQPARYEADGEPFVGSIIDVDATGRLGIWHAGQVRYFGFKEVSFM
jgi:BirA family transcriptional regulator, biotin operon repressor / biotin---[acetyl-CoA-carboxylase] ligase